MTLIEKLRQSPGIVALAVLALLAAGYGAAQFALGPKVPAFRAQRSDLVQTVVASGRIVTPLRVDIGAQVTGTVASVPVAEGQAVKAGQMLITLEDGEARAAADQARAAVAAAEARLQQLREVGLPLAQQALRQAEFNLQNVRRQHVRTRELHGKGFVGQAQLDDAQHNLDLAEVQLRSAQLQVDTNRAQGSDYLMAQAALEQARANLKLALARLDYTTIEAPADGTLIARNVERGDVVQPGKALMVLSPAGKTQVVVQIDEKNLGALKPGLRALGAADAYPEQRFGAELVYINPGVDPQRGTVEVKFDVREPPPFLRQDMTVSVDVEVGRRSGALVLPMAALHDDNGAPWVLKLSDGRAARQPVKLGLRGAGNVEITEGLQSGDLVLSALGAKIRDGQRVRAAVAAAGKS